MDKDEIQQKTAELQQIILEYKNELGVAERELSQAILNYQKALEDEKISEIKKSLDK